MVNANVIALDVDKLTRDWRWVVECLREVIRESGETEIAALLPSSDPDVTLPTSMPRDSVRLTQAYSIAFQLLSMAEQNASVQFRREIESTQGIDAVPALWGESLKRLLEQGWTAEEIAASLHKMQVELVLTAHPTEAKRATVLAHHRRLFERFVLRDRADLSPGNFEENEEVIRLDCHLVAHR